MAFPLVWRSTHDAVVARYEAEARMARADADRALERLSEAQERLSASETARLESERMTQEMAGTLLEFANGKKLDEEADEAKPEPPMNISTTPKSRMARLIERASAEKRKGPSRHENVTR